MSYAPLSKTLDKRHSHKPYATQQTSAAYPCSLSRKETLMVSAQGQTSTTTVFQQILAIIAFGTVLSVNALANIIPINGLTTGEISDGFQSLVTPAGYVFSIWGLIYLLLTGFVIYQALPSQKNNPVLANIRSLFSLSCLFNSAWIFAWHYMLFWLSEVFMLGLLFSLIAIYIQLDKSQAQKGLERFTIRLPFSVYLGWITAATILNTTVILLNAGLTGGNAAPLWGVIMIGAALLIALLILIRKHDLAYVGVLIWAFIGIAVAEWTITPAVVAASLIAAACLLGFSLYTATQLRGRPA